MEAELTTDGADAIGVLICCFSISAMCGLAVILKGNKPITTRIAVAAFLHNGLSGLIVGLLWFNYLGQTNPYLVVGASGLIGMGTFKLLDLATGVLETLQITIAKNTKLILS